MKSTQSNCLNVFSKIYDSGKRDECYTPQINAHVHCRLIVVLQAVKLFRKNCVVLIRDDNFTRVAQ